MNVIRKTRINWVLSDTAIIAFDNLQATCYNIFNGQNKRHFADMTDIILSSDDTDYNSWVDVICLAQDMGMIGYGTRIRQEWLNR